MSKIRDAILAADDRTGELYEIPEWGVTVQIRSMSARTRALFVGEIAETDGSMQVNDPNRIEQMWFHVISQTCYVPDTGELVFTSEDIDDLMGKSAKVVNDLANRCMEVSGLTDEAAGDAGKDSSGLLIDEADETLNDGSTSG